MSSRRRSVQLADRISTNPQAVGFDGHVRGVISELEGVFQVFEDVSEVRYEHERVCVFFLSDLFFFALDFPLHPTTSNSSSSDPGSHVRLLFPLPSSPFHRCGPCPAVYREREEREDCSPFPPRQIASKELSVDGQYKSPFFTYQVEGRSLTAVNA